MRFAATQKLLTYLLALVAVTPLLFSGEIALVVAVAFGVLAVGGWFLEPPLTVAPRFRRAVLALVLGLLALQVARAAAGAPVARMGLEYAVLLLGIKLASRGGAGDYQQIVILGFLHVIGGTIATFELSFAAAFAAFVLLSAPVLALAHLRHEMERRFRHDDRPEGRRALERLLASKRVVSPRFVIGTGLLSLPVLVITALLFLTFPRFGLGFLGRLPGGVSMGGFTDEVRIGDLDETRREETVVLRLEPFGGESRPAVLKLKLRGAAFDTYAGDTWTKSGERDWRALRHQGHDYPITQALVDADTIGFEVLLEPLEPPYLFVPAGTGLIRTYPVGKQGLVKVRRLEANRLGMIRYSDDAKVGIRYRVYLTDLARRQVVPELGAGDAEADPARYLQLPPNADRLATLARQLAGAGDAATRARRLAARLKGEYRYADRLDPGADRGAGATPLERFLFARRSGTCEHFATALTLLLRAEGIPARMVTGFASAEWNPIGEYYAVRARAAHAWTEARIDGRWITLDATPPNPRAGPRQEPSTLALMLDALRMRWHRHVVGYDISSQLEVVEQLRRLWARPTGGVGWPTISRRAIWAAVGAVIALAVAVALIRRRLRRGPAPRRSATRPPPEVAAATALYRALERRLDRLGLPRPPERTPGEHAAALELIDGAVGPVARRITDRYHQVRFGGRTFAAGEVERLRVEIGAIERSPEGPRLASAG